MKITDVRVTPAAIPITEALLHSWGTHLGFGRLVIEVDTDEGITGLGECSLWPNRGMEDVMSTAVRAVIGEDPFQLERIKAKVAVPFYLRMFGPGPLTAYAALEFACLDIQGQAIGRPVCDLLGGRLRDTVPFSAYCFYPAGKGGTDETAVAFLDDTARYVADLGFTSIKFKCGVFEPDVEVETFAELRRRFPLLPIRMDPNSIWSISTSAHVARRLRAFDPEYLEDPVWGMAGMAKLKRMVHDIPLASNMAVFGFDDVGPGALLDAVDVVLADPHWYGGLRAVKELGRLCETFGLDLGMHSGTEFGISMAAMVHVCASLSMLSHQPDSHYHYLSEDVITEPFEFAAGEVRVPDQSGLGVTLDRDKLARANELYEEVMAGTGDLSPDAILPSRPALKPRY